MTHYERIKKIIDALPTESRRVCPSSGPCACRGCIGIYGIKPHHLKLYNENKLTATK